MFEIVADLHLHSPYSRAVSPQMNLLDMQMVAMQKGIDLLSTGDFTHPLWLKEIRGQMEEDGEGVYRLKREPVSVKREERPHPNPLLKGEGNHKDVKFVLGTEIATIFTQNGKGRRIHQLVFAPSFETAEKINKELTKRGCNLASDGRPIIGLSSKQLLQLILEIDERSLLIPAHVWTPWFGVYGEKSGFTSLEEAFEDLSPYVYAVETGLSSDPEMNWQVKELDTRSILSFSDAHSLPKMGREATVFGLEEVRYDAMREAIMRPSLTIENRKLKEDIEGRKLKVENQSSTLYPQSQPSTVNIPPSNRVLYTIEFYPEEGKYHYSGHRKCGVFMTPEEQRAVNNICPVCHKRLTDGVMRRVEELSQKDNSATHKLNGQKIVWITDKRNIHPPFVKIVPLPEIIAEVLGRPANSPKVKAVFEEVTQKVGSEFEILLKVPIEEIELFDFAQGKKLAEAIERVRQEQITIKPGYDGVYGTVTIFPENSENAEKPENQKTKDKKQLGMDF